MKRLPAILIITVASLAITSTACKGNQGNSNAVANTQLPLSSSNANSNQSEHVGNANAVPSSPGTPTAPTAAPAETKPAAKAELLGTYESREVQDKTGVVTLMSQLKTRWNFSPDGTYMRVSEVKGKPYHADSGSFRVEPPDKLVLSIQVTGLKQQRKMQNPPISKTHKFELSPDGEELRLTSDKGTVGIFRRTFKPKV